MEILSRCRPAQVVIVANTTPMPPARGCRKPQAGLLSFGPPVGRILVGSCPRGHPVLVMASSTAFCSYVYAVTVLLQFTLGNTVFAQEGQATTATASANDRGDACQQSIAKVIDLCMIRGLNNIGRVNCDCVEDGRKWTCTGTAACKKLKGRPQH